MPNFLVGKSIIYLIMVSIQVVNMKLIRCPNPFTKCNYYSNSLPYCYVYSAPRIIPTLKRRFLVDLAKDVRM